MCNESVDDSLAAFIFFPDWFVTSKMLEKFNNALHANDDVFFFNEDFDKVTFIANQRNILAADLDKINLDNDNNFDEDDLVHARLLAWYRKFEKQNALKKS